MPAETVRVAVRCRPFNSREKDLKSAGCLTINGATCIIEDVDRDKKHDYTFDFSYWMDTEQETVYQDLGVPSLDKAMAGFNATIFAYGQTGSGKSFSMMGAGGVTSDLRGIIPRLNVELFGRIEGSTDREFLVTCSYLEIYNENIRDLLNPSDDALKIREHRKLGVYVDGLAEMVVKTADDVENLIEQGNKVRAVAATNMNATSSRSHSVFTLKISQRTKESQTTDKKGKKVMQTTSFNSKINLVDLAGSERASSTGATGDRLKEGAMINKSLSALGNVINALADTKKKKGHIPYRDSKLTRILQESLGGNCTTVMLAALSPALVNFDETKSTLQFANRAKNITNNAKKNESKNQRVVRELREEVETLRKQLASMGGSGSAVGSQDDESKAKMEEMQRTIDELEAMKREGWEAREAASREMEAERVKNMNDRGIMELVMQNIKEEQDAMQSRLGDLQKKKAALIKAFTAVKTRLEKGKAVLQQVVKDYYGLNSQVENFDGDASALAQITARRDKKQKQMFTLTQELKKNQEAQGALKAKIVEVAELQKGEASNFAAKSLLLGGGESLRESIREEERKRLQEETDARISDEKKRLRKEMKEEQEALRKEFAAKGESSGDTVPRDELLAVEMKLLQAESARQLLSVKYSAKKEEVNRLQAEFDVEWEQHKNEARRQELKHLEMLQTYRNQTSAQQVALQRITTTAVGDAMRIHSHSVVLEDILRKNGISFPELKNPLMLQEPAKKRRSSSSSEPKPSKSKSKSKSSSKSKSKSKSKKEEEKAAPDAPAPAAADSSPAIGDGVPGSPSISRPTEGASPLAPPIKRSLPVARTGSVANIASLSGPGKKKTVGAMPLLTRKSSPLQQSTPVE